MPDLAIVIPWREPTTAGPRRLNLETVIDRWAHLFPNVEPVLADDPDPDSFNRGRALHAGIVSTDAPVLILADADMIVTELAVMASLAAIRDRQNAYAVPFDRLTFCDEVASAILRHPRHKLNPDDPDLGDQFNRRSDGGVNVLTREAYDQAGGFDHRFRGWGFEDAALSRALQVLVGPCWWAPFRGLHLWHPSARRPDSTEHAESVALIRRYEAAGEDRAQVAYIVGEHNPAFDTDWCDAGSGHLRREAGGFVVYVTDLGGSFKASLHAREADRDQFMASEEVVVTGLTPRLSAKASAQGWATAALEAAVGRQLSRPGDPR